MKTLGVDIGGTKTAIGIVDTKRGKVIDLHIMPSKKYKNDIKNLKEIVNSAIKIAQQNRVRHIGIGVPELITNDEIIKGNYNFNWNNKNLKEYFPKPYKVKVNSDVRCHLIAEQKFGKGINSKNFIYINIGSGLSYAHFKDKKIYAGDKGYAIHFASSVISLYDWKKNKKISIIPEDFYSGKEILKVIEKFGKSKSIHKVLASISESLGSLIANLINSVDPGLVVLGGGVVMHHEKFKKEVIQNTRRFILATDVKKIKIVSSQFKDITGVLGSGLLFN